MSRRPTTDLVTEANEALLDALTEIGLAASTALSTEPTSDKNGRDFVVQVEGEKVGVVTQSLVTAADAQHLVRLLGQSSAMVVADRIAEQAKEEFRREDVGYLDRRGELRLFAGPLRIDSRVASSISKSSNEGGPLSSQVAKEVAIACLLIPDERHGVRQVAETIARAPSAVSTAMANLRNAGLLTSAGEALCPDLFYETVANWHRQPVMLANLPTPILQSDGDQLSLGLTEPEAILGWALTDTLAAASWGMPVVAQGDYPPDFYVPSEAVLRRAIRLLGETTDASKRSCTVAVAPVRFACLRRYDHSQTSGQQWPVANHVVVALDIASDRARGLEVLEQWHPEGIVRAW